MPRPWQAEVKRELQAPRQSAIATRRRRLRGVELLTEALVRGAVPHRVDTVVQVVAEADALEWCVRKWRDAARQRCALRGDVRQPQRPTAGAPWLALGRAVEQAGTRRPCVGAAKGKSM